MDKPSWSSAPEGASYLAQNSGGTWNWFQSYPSAQNGMWSGGVSWYAGGGSCNRDWMSTVEARPR